MNYKTVQNVISKLEKLGYANATYSFGRFHFDNPVSEVTLVHNPITNYFAIKFNENEMSPQGLTIFILQANRVSKHVEELNNLL